MGAGTGYTACGVGGSKRDSTDAEEAEAVEPECLTPVKPELSSDFDIACLKFSGVRRGLEEDMFLCGSTGLEIWRTEVGDLRVGAAAIGL